MSASSKTKSEGGEEGEKGRGDISFASPDLFTLQCDCDIAVKVERGWGCMGAKLGWGGVHETEVRMERGVGLRLGWGRGCMRPRLGV